MDGTKERRIISIKGKKGSTLQKRTWRRKSLREGRGGEKKGRTGNYLRGLRHLGREEGTSSLAGDPFRREGNRRFIYREMGNTSRAEGRGARGTF